ncbi:hypothetical protein DICPUDRAFT_56468 [Dictyostelium purpureum]|uniref:DEX1 C-terminal domain-containing protein n=1 Tax=Dictyostelium purpureum TaxID=5786 RepID=F0ZRR7_DICPU|nr:uncharacterized protein DICPUDRAFT_56468 [Dictyostelium purpureum]EGC33355.1 hypothetical protein DICPUDRAFT_56468 [Dictyostelium purpureum]|eukprot:XP_003290106.1 hypothetical protein DICPUDRAFT_56468 [Dictyostelium purpureum]
MYNNNSIYKNLIRIFIVLINFKIIYSIEFKGEKGDIALLDNEYRNREPIKLEDILFGKTIENGLVKELNVGNEKCQKVDLDVVWETVLASTIPNTPLITDQLSVSDNGQLTGDKYIVVANSHTYIDVINGRDGDRLIGWPFIIPDSSFASSPLLYDIDGDQSLDIMVTTTDAEMVFISSNGMAIREKSLKVPPLKIKKLWHEGIGGNHVDAAFSLYNKDNKKFAIQKQIELQRQNEEANKKEDQQQQQQQKLTVLEQGKDDEYDPLYSLAYDKWLNQNKWFSRKDDSYTWVDSHVLATPVIADIDDDGIKELIVSVSYYYDQEKYANPIYRSKLESDILIENYIAGGITVFDLSTGDIKWQTHLDLTTDKTAFKGSIYGSPTVVDLDGDGKLEIIIGTALGFVYVLNHLGNPWEGNYPLVLDSVFTQIVTEDLNADGKLELIVFDNNGNIVCFSYNGDQIWDNKVSSGKSEFPASIGDIDGDGILDVVLSTFNAGIFAWNGMTGKSLEGFPIKFESSIISPLLLLDTDNSNGGMTIFVHADDGMVYSINGKDRCVNRIDIGDFSITKILSSDLTGDGNLNLLLSTYDHKMYCLNVNGVPYSSRKSVEAYNPNGNSFTSYSREAPTGVMILPSYRNLRDITGSELNLEFLIMDQKGLVVNNAKNIKYTVSIYFGQIRLFRDVYFTTGIKQVSITIPSALSRTDPNSLRVEMVNSNGQSYHDSIIISFNHYFYRLLKFIIILPIIISTTLILIHQNSSNKSILS